ncbi:hypothetical protein D5S18_14370 [Nocardia panacis]|uniref:Uncharacterized protein n=2 Tax=Nocardia panacis TaxID=2340916 RepID=A0A3A4L152_9NOCA|nr:hypothetical protein D5S18_14370 [Nocardia panacis]
MDGAEIRWRAGVSARRAISRPRTWDAAGAKLFGRTPPDWDAALREFRAGVGRPVLLDRARAERIAAAHPTATKAVIDAAEGYLDGEVRLLGYPPAAIGVEIDWNYEPLSGTRWPAIDSERIDHRTAAGDPKWIWELNRLQHLPWLAQSWLFTGEERFAEAAFAHLDSWMDQQPPGIGIAWRGGFECGLRATSIAIALQGLRDSKSLTVQRYARLMTLLAESARRCWTWRSLHSSANNHLIGEMTGLAVVAVLHPELPSAARWEHDALELLVRHADRQLLPDGSGAEQSLAYQVFTAEMLSVVYALLVLREGDPGVASAGADSAPLDSGTVPVFAPGTGASAESLRAAIVRSSRYLAQLVGDDPQPRYGDDDGGFALRLGPEDVRTVREHLGIAQALAPEPQSARIATSTMAAHWLRIALGSQSLAALKPPGSFAAMDSGLAVLRSGRRRVSMDIGALGYLSIAAHGHADALAVTLAQDGAELIGDPGTASYYPEPNWHTVHRSSRVHATVTVDGLDQSVAGGPFLWTDHARVRVRSVDLQRGVIDAEHDGYRRLVEPVTHRRWLIAPPDDRVLTVVDLLSGKGIHTAQLSWPLHPALEVAPIANGHLVTRDGTPALAIGYAGTSPPATNQIRGDEQTDLGWWSERLEQRKPSWLIGALYSGALPLVTITVLVPDRATPLRDLGIAHIGTEIRAQWTDDAPRALVIDTARDGAVHLSTPDR